MNGRKLGLPQFTKTKIGVSDKSIMKIQQLLQNAVNEAIKWFGLKKLSLNIDKCNVLIISN